MGPAKLSLLDAGGIELLGDATNAALRQVTAMSLYTIGEDVKHLAKYAMFSQAKSLEYFITVGAK